MEAVYRFLASNEVLIYLLLALAGLLAGRWLWNSFREWQDSVFGLEREFAMRRMSQALAVFVLVILLFFGQIVIASFVAPALPATATMSTPTLDLLAMPDGTDGAESGAAPATPQPVASEDDASGCVPGEIMFTFPEPGDQVSGIVELTGTVNVENFGFYKYEVAPANTGVWSTIFARTDVVSNGDLGTWDASTLTPGDYQLRIVIIDNVGQELPPCVIPVQVVAP
ncbi:MAG: hypothetical protein Kow002_01400 [Anaerolineales bacterium]